MKQATASISVTPYNVTYDGNPHTAMGTATGVGGIDLSADLNLSGTTHTHAGTYNGDAWSFHDASGNYADASGTVNDTINQATANITVTPYSVTYDAAAHTATGTAKGVGGIDLSADLNLSGTTHTSAGTYTDTWTFTDSTGNYNNTSSTITDTINKATATVVVTPYTVTYDGNAHTATVTSITGVNGETGATVGTVTLNTTHTNAGTYASDSWSFTGAANYNNIASTAITDTICKATATVVVTPYTVTYDGNAHTATVTSITGVNGETGATVGAVTLNTTHTAAGTYASDSWSFTGAANYNSIASTPITDTINKATATVVVTPYTVTYDGNPHTATVTSITGVNGETGATVGAVTLSTTHTAAATYASDSWSFTGAANYNNIASTTITDTINKATATVVVTPYTVTYDGNSHTANVTSITGVNGETGATVGTVTLNTTHTAAGTYASDSWSFTGAANYNNIASTTIQDVINAAPLTITASSGSMTYGGSPFVVGPIYSAFVNGEGPNSLTTQPVCVPVFTNFTSAGTYASSCSGAVDPNYSFTYYAGSVMVKQASTTTVVVSSMNPSTFMQLVTFTATVTPQYSGTTPTGTVTFYNNGSQIGTGTLSVASCSTPPCPDQATFSTSTLPASGTDNITAVYAGDGNFTGSSNTTSPLVQTVSPAPNVSLSPLFVSFGNQNLNTTSPGIKVTLSNAGDAALTPIKIQLSGDYPGDFTQTNNCPTSLAPNNSCTITVTFTPVDTGALDAVLTITDNDDDSLNAQQFVSLTGSGLSTITGRSLYCDAIFATANGCDSIVMSGGSTVDSFDSTIPGFSSSHQLSGGNVGANGTVTLNGSTTAIYGSLSALAGNCSKSPTGFTSNGGAQATGGLITLNGPRTYAGPPTPNSPPPVTTQNISGSCGSISGCTNTGTKTVSLAPGQYGNLTISGGTTAHVSTGTYNINSLTLSGNSILYVDSGPVIANLAGASLSGGNPAMDLSGGSIQNPSGIPANLQFAYGGSNGVNLTGGSGSYAIVYAPNALINMSGGSDFFGSVIGSTVTYSGRTAFHYDRHLPDIQPGNYIWFNAVLNNVTGLPSGSNPAQVKLYLTDSTISFTANGTNYSVPVPNAVVTFNSASGTTPKTSYDLTNNRWSTSIPASKLTGNTFVTGVAFLVPTDFPTGIQNVSWSAAFSTDTPGIALQWQWAAAVYKSFNTTYATTTPTNSNVLGVNAEDGSADTNGTDPAGTPETYKTALIFGATSGGGTDYTGHFTSGAGIVPSLAPMSVSPSSLDFLPQKQGTTSAALTAVLTNNDSGSYTISSIAIQGTNAGDFAQTNTCGSMPATLAAGASCTITATFTPSDVDTRTAKIVITEGAKNSPQTVYLSGTGQ